MQTQICLNVSKTELVLFRSAKKQLDFGLNLKLNGKRLYTTNSVMYLGVKIDEYLTWKPQTDGISTKLNKANAILSNVRHFVDQKTLKAIYHAIFESHLYSSSLVWAQNFNSTKRLFILQKKALRLMFFLRILISLNSMIGLHLKIAFSYINLLNNNFPNHLITGLDLPQIFIPTTQGGQIWAVFMYLLTELNYRNTSIKRPRRLLNFLNF